MRGIIWLVLLFVVAVVAATTLGRNDGLVSIYFGAWRTDLSLNLFVILVLAACAVLMAAARSISGLISLPQRAREWRELKRERAGQAALREALAELLAARYSRAHRAAQRALAIQADTEVLRADADFRALAQVLGASSLHSMHDRPRRDEMLRQVWHTPRIAGAPRPVEEGALLLGAEWAIDDRDAAHAIELLAELPAGVARRTQALRLRLLAQRLSRQPLPALQTARLLAKHQAFAPGSRPACCVLWPARRSMPRSTPTRCGACGRSSTLPTAATPVWLRGQRRARRASARTKTRATGCGRCGSASPNSMPTSASQWRWRCCRRCPACRRIGCRGWKVQRSNCRPMPRSPRPWARRWSSGSFGARRAGRWSRPPRRWRCSPPPGAARGACWRNWRSKTATTQEHSAACARQPASTEEAPGALL